MKTMMAFGISASLALAMSVSTSAQQPGTPGAQGQTNRSMSDRYESKETTLTGCVTPNKSGGYFLTKASMSSMSDMNRTGDTRPGTTPGTTGTTGTTAGSSTSGQQMMSANTYNLENGRDMQQYVNKKVEVVGHIENSTSGDKMKNAPSNSTEIEARDFDVKSVRTVASSC